MGRVSEFLFTGAGVLPVILFLAGEPLWAGFAATFLCIAGAVCSIGDPEAPHNKRGPW
jgi:hypothetical protein